MSIEVDKNLKTAELEACFQEFEETQDKQAVCQKIFRIFEKILKSENLVYKDRTELRSSFAPTFHYSDELYPIAAYVAALIGFKKPYFCIFGQRVEQAPAVTQSSLILVDRFRTIRKAEGVTAQDLLHFDAAWDDFEISYLTNMKESIEQEKERLRQLGLENTEQFFERLSELFPYCPLNYSVYTIAQELPESHPLSSLAEEIDASIRSLHNRFENFAEPFSKDFPLPLLLEIKECQKMLSTFEHLYSNP